MVDRNERRVSVLRADFFIKGLKKNKEKSGLRVKARNDKGKRILDSRWSLPRT